jgi:hypothetical protein
MGVRTILAAVLMAAALLLAPPVGNAEPMQSQSPSLLLAQNANTPKGSYQQSCSCQISGGVTLMCYCANLQGRMFQTNMDVRQCPLPKDIKNCNGNLKCIEKGQEC